MIKTILRLRRDNDYNYAKIKDTFIPQNGEVCLVDTARNGLCAVVGDGVSTFGQLQYVGQHFLQGYYNELLDNFYEDSNFTKKLDSRSNIIYLDLISNYLFYFYNNKYIKIDHGLPTASETIAGVLKIYNTIGQNTDGTMTQKAITDELNTKVEVSLKEDDELVIFSL